MLDMQTKINNWATNKFQATYNLNYTRHSLQWSYKIWQSKVNWKIDFAIFSFCRIKMIYYAFTNLCANRKISTQQWAHLIKFVHC